jgi:hypothetical protein
MKNDRTTPGLGFAVLLVLPVFYLLLLGPACWLSSRWGGTAIVSHVYRPVTWAAEITESDTLLEGLEWYSELGSTEFSEWEFDPDNPGHSKWNSGADIEWRGVL